jgi:hypothetical protein
MVGGEKPTTLETAATLMNILFVCHRLPFPPNRGGKIRPFNMIAHLSKSHSVTVATLAHSREELEEGKPLKTYCKDLIVQTVPSEKRWMAALGACPSRMPSSAAYFWSRPLHDKIRDAAASQTFDLIWVHCAFVARYVIGLKAAHKVLDYGDLDSGKWLDYSWHRAAPLSWGYALEARKLRTYEKYLASQFDECTVTSPGELDEFRNLGTTRDCTLITNGVDMEYFAFRPRPSCGPPVIAFLGRMDYFPNVDGVLQFARDILPLVRVRVPDVHFRIIGSNPISKVRRLADIGGVSVTGFVPDVRPHMSDVAVAVVPLNISRGTQNKMLECMSMGVPVVASRQAAKGVQATAGQHYLMGDDVRSFADQVVALLHNYDLSARLASAARTRVENAHSWPKSMVAVDAILSHAGRSERRRLTTAELV